MQLQSILSEMLDLLLYKKVLKEETAEDYFNFLMQDGLETVNWNSTGKELSGELEYVNTVKRFNQQIRNANIRNDFFEGDSFGTFMVKFLKRVNREHLDVEKRRKVLTLFTNYCYHFAEMHDINSDTSPSYRDHAIWVNKNREKEMGVPDFLKKLV